MRALRMRAMRALRALERLVCFPESRTIPAGASQVRVRVRRRDVDLSSGMAPTQEGVVV